MKQKLWMLNLQVEELLPAPEPAKMGGTKDRGGQPGSDTGCEPTTPRKPRKSARPECVAKQSGNTF